MPDYMCSTLRWPQVRPEAKVLHFKCLCIRNKAPSYVTKRQNHKDLEVTFFTLESVDPHLADAGNPLP
jgi:hypothetical protein